MIDLILVLGSLVGIVISLVLVVIGLRSDDRWITVAGVLAAVACGVAFGGATMIFVMAL